MPTFYEWTGEIGNLPTKFGNIQNEVGYIPGVSRSNTGEGSNSYGEHGDFCRVAKS